MAKKIPAIKVRQWLPDWERVEFDAEQRRRRPNDHFLLLSIKATELKALTGIQRRSTSEGFQRAQDTRIQRRHEPSRSAEIREFVRFGFPWSELSSRKRESGEFDDLIKPGWLPTSIVVNILGPDDRRGDQTVATDDLIRVAASKDESLSYVELPEDFEGGSWEPKDLHPVEVIDGQHRLWAFENVENLENFSLPVVAFLSLDISWQAYLFWTINIKPKKINSSLAFDLYPLLRSEDWLDRFHGHSIYRETRAQEITESIWGHTESPWFHRINMLGEPGLRGRMVTQAAMIRSLTSTFIKTWETSENRIGGLFGTPRGEDNLVLPWQRAQQAAFLIECGRALRDEIAEQGSDWAVALRVDSADLPDDLDPAFYAETCLLSTDQGMRGFLYVFNDLCFVRSSEFGLDTWAVDEAESGIDDIEISKALSSISDQSWVHFLHSIAKRLSSFDWRTSSADGLSNDERLAKAALRGGGGYRLLREQLLRHLAQSEDLEIAKAAKDVIDRLGY